MDWEHGILALAAVIASVGVIWRGLISPLIAALDKARTLEGMAKELTTNGGSSLRGQIDRIEAKADEAVRLAEEAAKKSAPGGDG